jgi:hypothetical protein
LCGLVLLRCGEHDARCAARFQRRQGRVEQHPADAMLPMRGIDHDVVHHARRSAQRHVVEVLDAGVAVAEHLAVPFGNEHHDVRRFELRAEE